MRHGDWIQTYTGRQFWPLDPRPEEVGIRDIAHALSNTCRFTGHCRQFYSVAQHSVHVAATVWAHIEPDTAEQWKTVLWALLHDASEAYLCDVARPIKRLPEMEPYRQAEAKLQAVICHAFRLEPIEPEIVKHYDQVLLATEKRDLMLTPPAPWHEMPPPLEDKIEKWSPEVAEQQFLRIFDRVVQQIAIAEVQESRVYRR